MLISLHHALFRVGITLVVPKGDFTVKELSTSTLADFEKLAVKQGGCWCMYYQRPKPVGKGLSMDKRKRNNQRDKEMLIRERRAHAVLVYDGKRAIGWSVLH